MLATSLSGAGPAQARRHPAPTPSPSAIPTPLVTPLSQTVRFATLHDRMLEIAGTAPGRLGIALEDLATDRRLSIHGDETFAFPGVDRLSVAVAAYRLADQKRFVLDDDVPGGGAFVPTWRAIRATLAGDEAASASLRAMLGGPAGLRALFARLHLGTLDTPDGVLALLDGLARQRLTLLDSTYELVRALGDASAAPGRLRAGLPASLRLAHVSGASDDAGFITLPDGRRIAIVVVLRSGAEQSARDATFARVARAVAEAYVP
ncbi:MAG: hypothetical protein NVS2B3_07100 [Vulcanimicrobiaceae bacterium]